MVNVLSLPDDLLGRLAYPEGWHDFQWWITLRLGFQAPEMELTGPVERGLIELNSNEWRVQASSDLKGEIPEYTRKCALTEKTFFPSPSYPCISLQPRVVQTSPVA